MRNPAILLAALLPACTTTFAEPRILVSPYLAVYRLRGDTGMQSQPTPGGPLQDNASQPLRTFGQDHFREDIGLRTDIGDGFGGLRIDYYRLDQNTARGGVLDADWGRLLAGDTVKMRAAMDELRIGYLEPVLHLRSTWRERPLHLKAAVGGVFTHRDLDLRSVTEDGSRSQNTTVNGDVVAAAVRLRATWREFGLDFDYAISPNLSLGGDHEGVQQDAELRASWTMPLHDVTFFAGYRYSRIEAEGVANGFEYDADLVIDGFQFGVSVTF
jgi:hypothetical protein